MAVKSIHIKLSLFAYFFISAIVVVYIVTTQFSDQPDSASAINTAIPNAHDCGADASANPYAQAPLDCKQKPATPVAPVVSTANDAAAVGKNLRELAHCGNISGRCNDAAPVQEKLVTQLEDMSSKGNPQARYELALQLQRQEQGSDAKMPNADEVAANRNLQRSVALLTEAIAAGNEDAQKLRDSMGDQARLLHTGR
jgi:hypothetical protein